MPEESARVKSLERRLQQLLLLQDTVRKVNSVLDLEQLLDEIVGGVSAAFGCNRTSVFNYARWAFPKLEIDAPRQHAGVAHRAAISALSLIILSALVKAALRLFGIG